MTASGRGALARPLRVLVDTNVVLDLLFQREPWYTDAQAFWQARDAGRIVAYLPASTITDIFYIGRRHAGLVLARQAVDRCLREFGLIPVYRAILETALELPGPDFEDNVRIACAQFANLDIIVTRDAAGFHYAPIPALTPTAVIGYLAP